MEKGTKNHGWCSEVAKVGGAEEIPLINFSHFDLIEATDLSLFIVNKAMDARALYLQVKTFIRPSLGQFVISMYPEVFLSGSGATERARTSKDPDLFLLVQCTEW